MAFSRELWIQIKARLRKGSNHFRVSDTLLHQTYMPHFTTECCLYLSPCVAHYWHATCHYERMPCDVVCARHSALLSVSVSRWLIYFWLEMRGETTEHSTHAWLVRSCPASCFSSIRLLFSWYRAGPLDWRRDTKLLLTSIEKDCRFHSRPIWAWIVISSGNYEQDKWGRRK